MGDARMVGRAVHISVSVQMRWPVPAPPLRPAVGGMRAKWGRRAVGEGVQGFLFPLSGPEHSAMRKAWFFFSLDMSSKSTLAFQ